MLFDLALAVAGILAPADTDVTAPVAESAYRVVGLHLELLDRRELRWFFAKPEGIARDLVTLRERAAQLAGAPPLCDALRLPSREVCFACCATNRAYYAWLTERQQIDHSDWIAEAIAETEELYRAWDKARDAQCEWFYTHARRRALTELREWLGHRLYYAGSLPPPVPVWHFRSID